MQPGDIVLSVATIQDDRGTKVPRVFIRAGQWLKCKIFNGAEAPRVPIVHAAIAVGGNTVIESVGSGIVATNLANENPPRSAIVYSARSPQLAEAAALAASQFYNDRESSGITGRYSVWKAFLSIFKNNNGGGELTRRINESVAIGDSSFCSQFVANCYEIGNLYSSANLTPPPAPVFALRPSAMTPYELAEFCDQAGSDFLFTAFWQDGVEHALS
ncbi:hypothetical protein CXB49_20195 [Chromobacterium sp. ATCC 53434]|uniref:hypothetical protein n=1 Tax=Chromobacterium TaxID=535 RepID=UPI000C765456|nr:hypothetical protein [Chromobacterium sp. ATCC 53434]AUH52941.1 hypothetical protein CXB49_20195 [Chromobacterium sp. ATCC 53434]